MSKVKARRRARVGGASNSVTKAKAPTGAPVDSNTPAVRNTTATTTAMSNRGTQSLVMPALVALGCWGMAFSFIFLSAEQYHYLFGGVAVVMALMWSFSFGLRMRKVMQHK